MFTYPIGTLRPKAAVPPIPTTGQIAWWKGGEITDSSVNSHNGTLNGSPNPALTTGINGEANGAYSFVSANSQYIDFGSISAMKNVDRLTICTWMFLTSTNFLALGDAQASGLSGTRIQYSGSADTISFVIRNGAPTNFVSGLGGTFKDTWVHICAIFKGFEAVANDRAELYINNVADGSPAGTLPTLTANTTDNYRHGRVVGPTYSDGNIAETIVYDRVISAQDRADIFAQKT